MPEQAQAVRRALTSVSSTIKSPDSDVSPRAQASPPVTQPGDYFSAGRDSGNAKSNGNQGGIKFASLPTTTSRSAQIFDQNSPSFHRGSIASSASPGTTAQSPDEQDDQGGSRRPSDSFSISPSDYSLSRKSSVASVSFRPPQDPSLPQGLQRKTDGKRLRASSPKPVRFKRHVGFDNLPVGEATKFNTSSLTLNVRHQGYHPRRRSRTFMVGVDEHAYSDYALVWLLENLVDDGDEVVCVRVVETPVRGTDKSYLEEAKKMMHSITEKNTQNRAISIILEYSVGKLHATFQQLIQIYQPSMLIVGTRGRSLGGIQGLVNNRNSFSKYCLQYSPVPVVVVRPDDKRKKKKEKRSHDPSRQSYVSMLSSNEGVHEADKKVIGSYETETQIPPEEEAHRVAAALGLPAAFDPTIKPLPVPVAQNPRASTSSLLGSSVSTTEAAPETTPAAEQRRSSTPPPLRATEDSGDEDSEEEQFDVVSGQQALKSQREREQLAMQAQKERLHRMEVGEAAALLKSGGKITEEDEDEEDEASSQGSGGANRRSST